MLARAYARAARGSPARHAVPAGARDVAGARPDLPGRLPRRPERHQLERDRRRLLGGDRRRPHHATARTSTAPSPTTTPRATRTGRSTTTPTCPFEQAFPWSGTWDDLPAAHAAALFFDLLTMLGAVPAGRLLRRGRATATSLGLVLAYAWAAYPVHAVRAQLERQRLAGRAARDVGVPGARRIRARGVPCWRWRQRRSSRRSRSRRCGRAIARRRLRDAVAFSLAFGAVIGAGVRARCSPTAACASCGTGRSASSSGATRRSASGARRTGWAGCRTS